MQFTFRFLLQFLLHISIIASSISNTVHISFLLHAAAKQISTSIKLPVPHLHSFILHFVFACQLLLLQPLVSVLGTLLLHLFGVSDLVSDFQGRRNPDTDSEAVLQFLEQVKKAKEMEIDRKVPLDRFRFKKLGSPAVRTSLLHFSLLLRNHGNMFSVASQ
ncbi:hypothetical protein L6452_36820 [Arctium lappa]|uniref:Uncharacterized protein n=1 Tax=Arctium lappa TaxID=4217 RepID=A0ACB8Y2E6_ARCLA|nr:hypothetical protein L6452_36820 [Arctium lappa]